MLASRTARLHKALGKRTAQFALQQQHSVWRVSVCQSCCMTTTSAQPAHVWEPGGVAIVGAGLTGAVAAQELAAAGARVNVFDLGGGPGGRASSRKLADSAATVDHGMQALAPSDIPAVRQHLQGWLQEGVLAEWGAQGQLGRLDAATGKFVAHPGKLGEGPCEPGSLFGLLDKPGPLFVGVPSMASLISHELRGAPGCPITVHQRTRVESAHLCLSLQGSSASSTTSGAHASMWHLRGRSTARSQVHPQGAAQQELSDLGAYHALVLTDNMVARAGSPGYVHIDAHSSSSPKACTAISSALEKVGSLPRTPLFTLIATFPWQPHDEGDSVSSSSSNGLLPFHAASVHNSPEIAWVAVDSSKPGRSAQCHTVVAVTTPTFAAELLGAPSGGPLPPQTPEYLQERTQLVWRALEKVLLQATGGQPLPAPVTLRLHRWGSARASRPLVLQDIPCIHLAVPAAAGDAAAHEWSSAQSAESSAKGRESSGAGQASVSQQGTHSVPAPAALVVAGDFCVADGGCSAATGGEAAVLSGVAAAQAVLKILQRSGNRPRL